MKKIISLLLFVTSFATSITAADIEFHHGSWSEALDKAKSENRLIFVDFYTQWCGPCYNMAKTVFTLPDVAYFYNNNFVNVKIDCEDPAEGVELAKKYNVRSFPTYGFIDPSTGEMVHRSSSRQSAERFIQTGRDALDPERRSFRIDEKYESGDRSRALLTDYINYYASIYKHEKVNKAFDELMAGGAKLYEPEVWALFDEHIKGLTPYLGEVSGNYADYCSKLGKEVVDAKLRKETQYGDVERITALCDFDGKAFNLKMIDINNMLRNQDYTKAAAAIDALIADPAVDRQELIDRLKFMVRLSYKTEEMSDFWFDKCVGYLRFIAYNNSDRDDAQVHQQYADALEKYVARKQFAAPEITAAPSAGKTVYDMRPADLKQKPHK